MGDECGEIGTVERDILADLSQSGHTTETEVDQYLVERNSFSGD